MIDTTIVINNAKKEKLQKDIEFKLKHKKLYEKELGEINESK